MATEIFKKEQMLALIQGDEPKGFALLEMNQHRFTHEEGFKAQFKEVVFGHKGRFYCFMYDLAEGWEPCDSTEVWTDEVEALEVEFNDFSRPGWEVLP